MIAAFLILAHAAAFFGGFILGGRFQAAHQRVAGLLAAGERDTAVCDEADRATDGRY